MEVWKLRGLEAWFIRRPAGALLYLLNLLHLLLGDPILRPAGAFRGRGRFGPLGLHAPFSVFRSPGRASAPLVLLPKTCQSPLLNLL